MTNQIKCLVQGAQGVGKTTLIKEIQKLSETDMAIGASQEVARSLIRIGVKRDLSTRIEDYYAYLSEYLRHFREQNEPIVLLDRSVLDVIVYARMCIGTDSWVEKLGFEILELIRSKISCIFYIPIEFDVVYDGVRNTNESDRKLFDQILKKVMNDAELSYITLRGSIDQRSLMAFKEILKKR